MDRTTKTMTLLALGVWGAAAFFVLRSSESAHTAPNASPASTGSPAPTNPTPSARDTPAKAPPPSTASPEASAAAVAPDASRCMTSMLADDAFDEPPASLSKLCEQTNPLRGFASMKSAIVRAAGGGVTDGMRQWAGLGWYEIAAFAALRAHCCPSAKPLAWPFELSCPLDEAVAAFVAAIDSGDEEAVDEALGRYRREATCLYKLGQAENFGRSSPPGSGRANLEQMLSRARSRDDVPVPTGR